MKLKIFKPALYTIIMVLSIHSYASSQGTLPDKEAEMEQKMQNLELKLKDMQIKLDSMKNSQKSLGTISGLTNTQKKKLQETLQSLQGVDFKVATPTHPLVIVEGFGETIDETFKGLNRALNTNFNFNFNFDSSDKNLEEKIKSGEAKEKIKNYSKSYNAGPGDKLQIDNTYGKVTVNTWNKKEFKVDVEIKAITEEDEDTQRLLDGVSIADSKEGSVVSFTTNIADRGSKSWGIWSSGDRSHVYKLEINYTIYMPAKNSLNVTNKYGSTVLPDFDGKIIINSSYGSFTAKVLTNANNEITTRYGSTNIESLNGSELKIAYGNLNLGLSDNLNADISYGSARIDKIKNSGTITAKYSGGLRIGDLDKNFKNLLINASYSNVLIGLNNDPGFDFDISVHYGSFNYGDHNVNISNKTPEDGERGWNPTKTYKGHLGKANPDKLVTIRSTYGSVKFD